MLDLESAMDSGAFGIALQCIFVTMYQNNLLNLKAFGMQLIVMYENIKNTTLISLAKKQHK